jgi:hypothetical protein
MESEGNITTAASRTINSFEPESILYGTLRSCRFSSPITRLGIFFNFLINRYTDFEKPKEIQRIGRRPAWVQETVGQESIAQRPQRSRRWSGDGGETCASDTVGLVAETRIKGKHRTKVTEATEGGLGLVAGERQTLNAARRFAFFLK